MEVSIGDYGRMMFEMMTGKYDDMPEHWQSISAEATPLVRQLIELNKKMKSPEGDGGYKLTGYKDEKGKKQRPEHERIRLAQRQLWGIKAGDLKEGDRVWLLEEHDMDLMHQDACPVEYVKADYAAVEVPHCGGEHVEKIFKNETVLRAPADWDDKEEMYTSKTYWLERADELDI